ncbi:MAG: hypothetical protein KDI45_09975 [Candidatus Accumulibacter sp.]|nr:hypothetical protein [Accumulibacter sp.]
MFAAFTVVEHALKGLWMGKGLANGLASESPVGQKENDCRYRKTTPAITQPLRDTNALPREVRRPPPLVLIANTSGAVLLWAVTGHPDHFLASCCVKWAACRVKQHSYPYCKALLYCALQAQPESECQIFRHCSRRRTACQATTGSVRRRRDGAQKERACARRIRIADQRAIVARRSLAASGNP